MIYQQKKGFLIRDFVVIGILFGMIIAFYIIQVASLANNYPDNMIPNAAFEAHYAKLSTNIDRLNNATAAVQSAEGLTFTGTLDIVFTSVFTVIVMVWDNILLFTGMQSFLAGDFSFFDSGVLVLLVGGLLAILTTYLVFIWLSSISRGRL